jgi:hypothetical protein
MICEEVLVLVLVSSGLYGEKSRCLRVCDLWGVLPKWKRILKEILQ